MLELYYYNDQSSKIKILPKVMGMKDDKGETCLMKALKLKQLEMVYSII